MGRGRQRNDTCLLGRVPLLAAHVGQVVQRLVQARRGHGQSAMRITSTSRNCPIGSSPPPPPPTAYLFSEPTRASSSAEAGAPGGTVSDGYSSNLWRGKCNVPHRVSRATFPSARGHVLVPRAHVGPELHQQGRNLPQRLACSVSGRRRERSHTTRDERRPHRCTRCFLRRTYRPQSGAAHCRTGSVRSRRRRPPPAGTERCGSGRVPSKKETGRR